MPRVKCDAWRNFLTSQTRVFCNFQASKPGSSGQRKALWEQKELDYSETRGPSGPKALTWEQKELDYSEKMQADSWRLDQKSDF